MLLAQTRSASAKAARAAPRLSTFDDEADSPPGSTFAQDAAPPTHSPYSLARILFKPATSTLVQRLAVTLSATHLVPQRNMAIDNSHRRSVNRTSQLQNSPSTLHKYHASSNQPADTVILMTLNMHKQSGVQLATLLNCMSQVNQRATTRLDYCNAIYIWDAHRISRR